MRVRIEVRTPKGQAIKTAKRLKPFILGTAKVQNQVWANPDDDRIIWVVDGDPRLLCRIERNIALFDVTIKKVLQNPVLQKVAKLNAKDKAALDDMFTNHTKVRLIKAFDEMPPNFNGWQCANE